MSIGDGTAGRMVEVNGVSLYVEEYGEGDLLVLVHGGISSSTMWFAAGPLLAEHFRVIVYDTRGHGRSTNSSGELSYPLLADDTAALIAALGLERPFVGGYSDGGQMALEFGLRHPGVARALIAAGATYDFTNPTFREDMRVALGADEQGVIDFAAYEAAQSQWVGMLRGWHVRHPNQWQDVLRQSYPMWLEYPGLTQAQIEQITTPTLVLIGDRDEAIPVQAGLEMYSWLPDAELAILPGHDHVRLFMQPELFVAAVVDYLRRH